MSDESTRATAEAEPAGIGAILRLHVRLWVVVVFMALGFASGFFVRGLDDDAATTPVPAVADPSIRFDPQPLAPPLSEDQLRGGLPADHPVVGETPATTTATSSP